MKKLAHFKIGMILLTFILFSTNSRSQNSVDKSDYTIAIQYWKDKDFLFSYKYLIIFKFENLKRLEKPINREALDQLDSQILKLEDILSQSITVVTKGSAFSNLQKDSLNKKIKNIIFKDLKIY